MIDKSETFDGTANRLYMALFTGLLTFSYLHMI